MPKSFRDYEIVEKLGVGGMSTIYLGIQKNLGRKVAIKVLHPSLAGDQSYIHRFEREARAASSLGHNNIVTVIDFGSEDDVYYIVMEYIEGQDFHSLLQRVRPLPAEVTLAAMEEIALGLEAAHEQGIIHRDIKPGNVLLTGDGVVKVLDFGLARGRGDLDRLSGLTVPGSVFGTPAYMAPEQAGGQETDFRSDIFSLGVMAYECFSGGRPFQGSSHTEIKQEVLTKRVPSMRLGSPLLTREIDETVRRMLHKDPARRFQSMREVVEALEECMHTLDGPVAVMAYRRRVLRNFAIDPEGFTADLAEQRHKYHLDRGKYYMSLGLEQIDDAVRQFRLALVLDPLDEQARELLAELEMRRDATEPDGSAAAASPIGGDTGTEIATAATEPPPVPPRRRRRLGLAGLALAVLALIAWSVAFLGGERAPDERLGAPIPTDSLAAITPAVPLGEVDEAAATSPAPDTTTIAGGAPTPVARETSEGRPPASEPAASRSPSRAEPAAATREQRPATNPVPSPASEGPAVATSGSDTPHAAATEPPTSAPTSDLPGTIFVFAKPFANVYLDGKLLAQQKRRVAATVEADRPHVILIRHPTLGVHVWDDVRAAAGDTLYLRHTFLP